MKWSIFSLLFLLSLCPCISYAQDYSYSVVYDAFGPVKEIRTESKNPFVKGKVKIERNGQGDMPMMLYDDSGYPVGCEIKALGVQAFQKFYWNSENRLDSVAVQFPVFGKPTLLTGKNVYSGNYLHSQVLRIAKGDEVVEHLRTFSDYSYDENGSWISRSVSQEMTDRSGSKTIEEFQEIRKIKYYDPEKIKGK
ncbi:MAG: hypothetical protein K2K45_00080 [Muribaculaceae bacterium]|nr:hypothetical protein [Muribaculaceae bacterium]